MNFYLSNITVVETKPLHSKHLKNVVEIHSHSTSIHYLADIAAVIGPNFHFGVETPFFLHASSDQQFSSALATFRSTQKFFHETRFAFGARQIAISHVISQSMGTHFCE